ncbi:MAG: hypothetical protein IKE52_02950 [Mogibacterium sp.]|nr:hypothetical protein [Mogibacterium sp.]
MREIRLRAHAKLNLSLEVVGRRSDGYHNIVSLMQGIGLCDVVSIKKCAENGTKYNLPHCTIVGHVVYLCTNEKTIPTDISNLALKGIEAVLTAATEQFAEEELSGNSKPLLVEIEKRLPVAAGIAGGSGNGAAAMLGMNAIMGNPFSLRELMSIGVSVGADIPFSLFMNAYRNRDALTGLSGIEEASDAAWISGIGDEVEAEEPIERYVIMANPGISVSTAKAYEAIDSIGFTGEGAKKGRRLFVNDLEKYTLANYPEAFELKYAMENMLSADEILMSGSGPTIAAYYREEEKAERDLELLAEYKLSKPDIRIWLTATGIMQKEEQ